MGFDMAQTHSSTLPPLTPPFEAFVELKQSLPSQLSAVSPFLDQLMRFITRFRGTDGSEVEIEVAVREAILNAMIHGNAGDPCKRVYVDTRCSADGEVSITIGDQGQGFDWCAVPDPTCGETLMLSHGRGIRLMRALMDEVSFEEGGTVVYMRKTPPAWRLQQDSAGQPQSRWR